MRNKFVAGVAAILLLTTCPSNAGILDYFRGKSPADALKEELVAGMNKSKQAFFNAFHPTGTATKIEVHAVEIVWKNNKPSNNARDMLGFHVRFTIYWRGPITKDGFTKVHAVYDAESQRYIGSEVLATNGVTNEDVGKGVLEFLDGFLNGR